MISEKMFAALKELEKELVVGEGEVVSVSMHISPENKANLSVTTRNNVFRGEQLVRVYSALVDSDGNYFYNVEKTDNVILRSAARK